MSFNLVEMDGAFRKLDVVCVRWFVGVWHVYAVSRTVGRGCYFLFANCTNAVCCNMGVLIYRSSSKIR